MKRLNLLLIVVCLLFSSCMSQETKREKANQNLGSKSNPIKMYFVPSMESGKVLTSGEGIAAMLRKETGYYFKVAVPTSYAAVIEAIGAYQCDVAWLAPFAYIMAHEKFAAQVKFITIRKGLSEYRGQFVVREDSGIDSLAQLAGKVIAYTDASSTSGYIYPSAILKQQGIVPGKYTFAGGHPQAITSVYSGIADAACTYWSPPDINGKPMDAREKLLETYPDVFSKLRIIAYTDWIPNDTVTFRKDLPMDVESKLMQAMEKVASNPAGQNMLRELYDIDGLKPATNEDYDVVRNTLKALGKDPKDMFK